MLDNVLSRLKKRKDFLLLKRARRSTTPRLILLGKKTRSSNEGARLGFTVSSQVGNAVVRNRIRRRLKAIIEQSSSSCFEAGWDYNVIARKEILGRPFAVLCKDVQKVFQSIHLSNDKKRHVRG